MKHYLLTFILSILSFTIQAKDYELTPIFDMSAHYDFDLAIDKNLVAHPVIIDINGTDATYTILGDGFKPTKTFTIKNAYTTYIDENYGTESQEKSPTNISTLDYASLYQMETPMAIQGLLNDEDKWVISIYNSCSQIKEDRYLFYTEDGIQLPYIDDTIYCFGKWYAIKDGQIMSFRKNESSKSIEAVANAIKGRVYPNPARKSETVTIELAEEANDATAIKLFDINGRMLQNVRIKDGDNKAQVNTATLHSGTYIYHVTREDNVIDQGKIIIR